MQQWRHPQYIPNSQGFKLTVIYRDKTTHNTYIAKDDNSMYRIATHADGKTYNDVLGWKDCT